MEIDKIVFENLKNLNTENTFEELDTNQDGIISSQDINTTQNKSINEEIQKIIDHIDSENECTINDEDFKDSIKNLEELQKNIDKANEEINLTQNIIKNKENKKENLKNEQKEIEKELIGLQENLRAADSDDAKRNIQKQIISKSVENLAVLNQILQLNRTINVKTSEVESLSQDIKDLETKEATLTNEVETKLSAKDEIDETDKTDPKGTATKTDNNIGKNKYGLKALNTQNFNKAFDDTSGVQYIVLTLPACGRCHTLMKELGKELSSDELKYVAAFNFDEQYESRKFLENIAGNLGDKRQIYGGYPKVIKLVDGKPTKIIPYSSVPKLKKMITQNIGKES